MTRRISPASWMPLASTVSLRLQEGGRGEGTGLDPLAAELPVSGPIWGVVVPAALFLVALVATVLLYRHFARGSDGDDG